MRAAVEFSVGVPTHCDDPVPGCTIHGGVRVVGIGTNQDGEGRARPNPRPVAAEVAAGPIGGKPELMGQILVVARSLKNVSLVRYDVC